MSNGKLSEQERYNNFKREVEVIASINDLLLMGRFTGTVAMTLVTAQGYVKGLYQHMSAELQKMAPLELPKDNVPSTEDRPLESQASPVPEVPSVG